MVCERVYLEKKYSHEFGQMTFKFDFFDAPIKIDGIDEGINHIAEKDLRSSTFFDCQEILITQELPAFEYIEIHADSLALKIVSNRCTTPISDVPSDMDIVSGHKLRFHSQYGIA